MGEREHGWYHWVEKTVSIEVGLSLVLMVDSFTGRVWYCKIISSPRLLLRLNSVQDKAFQRSRTCPSCPMNTPFFTLEHALLLSCLYLFDIVLVAVSLFAYVALFSWWLLRVFLLSLFIGENYSLEIFSLTAFRMQVARWKFYLSQRLECKWLVGCFISHRFSQMNRSLSANGGNPQTPACRRQISQNLLLYITECYTHL